MVTHSSGNHAQALALAARRRGIAAYVVMPHTAAAVKRRAVVEYGARVIDCAPTLAAREAAAAALVAETGATLIPPFDHGDIIAGQGTAALELLAQVGGLDTLVAPVGGGGLVSGTCLAAHGLDPRLRVIAAEPAGADDAARSFAAGHRVAPGEAHTIADGLRTGLGTLTWPVIRDHVAAVVTVGEDEIRAALRLLWERTKLLVEPSSAVALAAVLSPAFPAAAQRVGIILSGGNVELPLPPT